MISIVSSMRVVRAGNYEEIRDAVAQDWTSWFAGLGCRTALVPNTLDDPAAMLSDSDVRVLVLPGGNDLVPRNGDDDDCAPDRDRTELLLLAKAIEREIPVFAVCRGMHVINRYFGGGLTPDIAGGAVNHVGANHEVALEPPFAALAGSPTIETNSYHNQAIHEDQVASEMHPMAISRKDGIVEALVHREQPLIGIQWHPERRNPARAFDKLLFERLLNEGAFWRNRN